MKIKEPKAYNKPLLAWWQRLEADLLRPYNARHECWKTYDYYKDEDMCKCSCGRLETLDDIRKELNYE